MHRLAYSVYSIDHDTVLPKGAFIVDVHAVSKNKAYPASYEAAGNMANYFHFRKPESARRARGSRSRASSERGTSWTPLPRTRPPTSGRSATTRHLRCVPPQLLLAGLLLLPHHRVPGGGGVLRDGLRTSTFPSCLTARRYWSVSWFLSLPLSLSLPPFVFHPQQHQPRGVAGRRQPRIMGLTLSYNDGRPFSQLTSEQQQQQQQHRARARRKEKVRKAMSDNGIERKAR